ncbi:hypothetical protein [Aquimarina spongiae]|uniref:DUF1579 domain-containing protein n=1 Tax=Aquimarina spongiae TaxID=570521 RepID=A0A1M6GDT0_9FLAO|nr:hypothetical protein [Aquimarina spongiae]SHJ08062.1 hypothetical protein SAMN04488508_105221 [Aquimarina spongiae]
MRSNTLHRTWKPFLWIAMVFFTFNLGYSQSVSEEKMGNLSFMIGEWIGTSSIFQKDSIVKVPAYEKVAYKLDKNIITIDLKSQSLQLHTVIHYDEKEGSYYYTPYSKGRGGKKYKGIYQDGKFIVAFSQSKRIVFGLTEEGHFIEYGEQLKNGEWQKYFEDILQKAP